MRLKHYIIGMCINCGWIGLMFLNHLIDNSEIGTSLQELNTMMALVVIFLLSLAYFKGE